MKTTRSVFGGLAAIGLCLALAGCSGITVPPLASGTRIEVAVSGGLAGVSYAFEVLGDERFVRGVSCSNGCDFEPGDVLLPLSIVQVTALAPDMEDAGILELDGTDFGEQCCDDFYYEVDYVSAGRTSRVEGSAALFPEELAAVIRRLVGFAQGTVPAVVDLTGSLTLPDAPLELGPHVLNGDLLEVEVSYGGGCALHEIDLVAVDGWLESNPVRVGTVLAHEDHQDPCDAFLTETRSFDLKPLAAAYREAYGPAAPDETTLVLLLPDEDEPDGFRAVEYVF